MPVTITREQIIEEVVTMWDQHLFSYIEIAEELGLTCDEVVNILEEVWNMEQKTNEITLKLSYDEFMAVYEEMLEGLLYMENDYYTAAMSKLQVVYDRVGK